ncbi:MAG: DNA-3-methyladenine glycosylase family protein [Burkholderiaceae bacterium]
MSSTKADHFSTQWGPLDWSESCQILANQDAVMRQIVASIGDSRLRSRGEPFTCLARSIVGQQISVKAADAVWFRLCGLLGQQPDQPLQPSRLIDAGVNIREAGLSAKKSDYLLDLANWFAGDPALSDRLATLSNEHVIELLTDRPGIGPWTAQMFLIFTLMRPDVFPADDLGVLKAIETLYVGELPMLQSNPTLPQRKKRALAFSERWAPHRTVATWLLWRSLDPVPVEY